MRAVLKLNMPLFWIGDDDNDQWRMQWRMQIRNMKQMLDTTCVVVQMFVNSTVIISPSMFSWLFVKLFLFCQCNWHDNQDKKNHKQQTNYTKQLFYLWCCNKTQFINVVLSLESNGTSFNAIRLNFFASKTWLA